MKKIRIWCFFLFFLLINEIACGATMKNQYYLWNDFTNNFGKELVSAEAVYEGMVKNGLKDFQYCNFDFHFQSNKKKNLENLESFLKSHYAYESKGIEKTDGLWELSGVTTEIPVTQDNLMYWAIDMAKRGFEFDSKLEGYGALVDNKKLAKPDFTKSKEDYYFNKAIEAYNAGDLSGAVINFSIAIEINSKDPNSYYSRAIVKNELYTWKSAMRDYDKAIELAPDFISALTNRGTLKDENGDYVGAIKDYDLVIKLSTKNLDNLQKAHFNRGNTKFNLNNKNAACADWKKALELGGGYAAERINKYCR